MMKTQVKALWQRCFQDSQEFTDLYFDMRYRGDRNLSIEQNGQVVAALQLLPYPMTFYGTALPMNYVSGACTHPDFRNQGLMPRLLQQALDKMVRTDNAFTTLIPAEPWLFNYYARWGYAPVFWKSNAVYHSLPMQTQTLQPDEQILSIKDGDEEIAQWMDRQYREQYTCCVLHPTQDLEMVYASQRLEHGRTYLLRRQGQLQAVAFAAPSPKGVWHVDELLSADKTASRRLLQHICETHQQPQITLSAPASIKDDGPENRPLGMARILQVRRVLEIYAKEHRNVELQLQIHDEQIPLNNGHYTLAEGKCTCHKQPLSATYTALTIRELTERLLIPTQPYMSLMLN